MSIIGSNVLAGASGGAGDTGYQIQRSVRLNSADSAYLSRTPSTTGNRRTWTWSGWVKQSNVITGYNHLFTNVNGIIIRLAQNPGNNRRIDFSSFNGSGFNWQLVTTAEFRDPSAWYHLVFVLDTTQATSSDRAKIYVNGVLQNAFNIAIYPTQNYQDTVNNTVSHRIGDYNGTNSTFFLNGYLADVHFIDGQALAASDFGEFDDNGVWQPKAYTGSYGTNGFHLPFSDNSTAAALGTDTSGNSNTWTVNNISVTADAGNDSLVDVPTNGTETDTGAGGEVRGNYATLNPLNKGSTVTLSNGNLDFASGAVYNSAFSTIGVTSGKWYMEATAGTFANDFVLGISNDVVGSTYVGGTSGSYAYEAANGAKYNNTSSTTTGYSTYTTGDIISVAFDADNGKVFFAKNGVWQESGNPATGANPAYSGLTAGPYFFGCSAGNGGTFTGANFGQRPFAYTAPSGFKALCTTNLPDPVVAKPSEVMDVALYTGNGSTQTISGLEFSPDLVWIKNRAAADNNKLLDTVRGATEELESNTTDAEVTNADGLTAFNSDGFDLGVDAEYNTNTEAYVAWTWDAGSSTVTNTDGSITSQVRANASAGFSIVTYTGNGTAGATVGHGLGVEPHFIICKSRSGSTGWLVYHKSLGNTNYLILNATDASAAAAGAWNNTTPTSSVFTIGTGSFVNTNGATQVSYCFAPVDGYSAFGSYTGSADGPFVYTGFRPRWVLTKRTDSAENWIIHDTARDQYNVTTKELIPNSTSAEGSTTPFDILSNGFKLRDSGGSINASGGTYIYAAFAENPFKTARAR